MPRSIRTTVRHRRGVLVWALVATVAVVAACTGLGPLDGPAPTPGSPSTATAFAAATTAAAHAQQKRCPWLDESLPVATRVAMLLARMSLKDKIVEMHVYGMTARGTYAGYDDFVPAQKALCIPAIIQSDGPSGVAASATRVTQLPSDTVLASTWDPGLARQYGAVNGAEQHGKGVSLVLAPDANVQRDPRWGRNFETFSEDPYLTGVLAAADVTGVQSQHVMADVKHFAGYAQETNRNTSLDDNIIGERALQEIYLQPFHPALVGAHAASVMCSYATTNGVDDCQNPYLLDTVLRKQWGYPGFVRSDGGGNHSTVASVNAGLDQEARNNYYIRDLLYDAVKHHKVSTATIDAALTRILTPMFALGQFNHPATGGVHTPVTTAAHVAFARTVSEQGTVLLKNSHSLLPLGTATTHSIALIGRGCSKPITSGGGSSHVTASRLVTPVAAIALRGGRSTNVVSYPGSNPVYAADAARKARVAIVCATQYETEARDLRSIDLPRDQDAVIAAVARANPHTVVVLDTGGPVAMPWLPDVSGVIEQWYAGEQDGNALAAILYGDIDPSGHLAETFPTSLAATPTASPRQFPGVNGTVDYSEGLAVGYRWYQQSHVAPLFPFGFGLSYTSFHYSGLELDAVSTRTADPTLSVTATVTNTGHRSGTTVAQLYLGYPGAIAEPGTSLQGFDRVTLAAGQSARVHFTLRSGNLHYWNTASHSWAVSAGRYQLYVGDSSAHLPLHSTATLTSAR